MFALPEIVVTCFSFLYYVMSTGLRGYLLRILVALGITYTTYTANNDVVNLLRSKFDLAAAGLPPSAHSILSDCGFFEASTIVFSCVATALIVKASGHFSMAK